MGFTEDYARKNLKILIEEKRKKAQVVYKEIEETKSFVIDFLDKMKKIFEFLDYRKIPIYKKKKDDADLNIIVFVGRDAQSFSLLFYEDKKEMELQANRRNARIFSLPISKSNALMLLCIGFESFVYEFK